MTDADFDSLAQQALLPPKPDDQTDYEALAGGVMQMQHAAATQQLVNAQGIDPDKTAQALQVSRQTGIPQPAAEENLEQAKQAAGLQKNVQTLQANPALSSFIAANPLAARMAQDDFDKLSLIERVATALKTGFTGALQSNELGRLGTIKQGADLIGASTPQTDQQIAQIQQQQAASPKLNGALGAVQSFTGFITGLVDNAIQGGTQGAVAGGLTGAGLGAAAGGVGAIPGAVAGMGVGGVVGFNVDMAQVAAGNAYLKMGQITGASGEHLSEAGKQFGAIITGVMTYALGTYASNVEGALVGQTAEALATRAVTEAVTVPTFTRALADAGLAVGKGAASGAGVMTAMEASSIIGEQVAKAVSQGNFGTDYGEIVERLKDAAINGALLLGTMHGAMHGIGLYGDFKAAQRADANAEMFKNLLDGAAGSKLRDRDLQSFQDFMQHQTDGSPVESLYLPAAKVRELYQGARIDPSKFGTADDPIFGFVPDIGRQLEEAGATDGDVVIPTADFVTHLAGTPTAEHLLPDLRVGADAMSVNEAREFAAEYQKRIKEATDEAGETPEPTSADKIADEVQAQAVAAGRPVAESRQVGALLAARYATRAARRGLGEDPYDLYKAEGPTIAADGAAVDKDGRVLAQAAYHGTPHRGIDKFSTDKLGIKGIKYLDGTSRADGEGSHNYVVFSGDDVAIKRQFYQAERGKISFSDPHAVISLFKNADSSTLVHEASHSWLEELLADASRPDAPQQLRDDLATVQKWLGHESGDFTTEQHEQFARAGEAYLMEGKAPSQGLARVFSRFKQWITKIYRTVANLDTPINDDIRGVFDRLLATDDEIAEATKTSGLEPNFKSREEAGMTQAEWGAYLRTIDKANQQAESTMLDKMMARVRRQRTAEYREERARMADEVAKEVDAQPAMQALNLLRNGRMPDGTEEKGARLSTDAIRSTYGDAMVDELPKGILSRDGVHPDYVAEILGFDSGDALVQSLKSLEDQQREIRKTEGEKRTIRQFQIDTETDRRMGERKGELEDEASIKDEAIAAVHSEGRAELLAVELRYLRRMGAQALESQGKKRQAAGTEEPTEGPAALKSAQWNEQADKDMASALRESVTVTKPMLDAIRAQVDAMLANKKTSDVGRYNNYLRDERKAAREVQQAILKKDWAAAASAKQRQMLSNILYTQAKKASAEVDRAEKTFKALTDKRTYKGIAQEYTDQIQDLLSRFGFDSGRGDELQRGKTQSLEEFVRSKADDGYDLAVGPALFTMQGMPLDDLTMTELRTLHEAIDSMHAVGRGEKIISVDGQMRDIGEIKDEMASAIRILGERLKSDFYEPKDAGKWAAFKDKLFGITRGIDASLTKPEAVFDQIDQGDPFGIMNRAVFRRLKESQGNEDRWQAAAAADLKDAVKAAGKDWDKHLRDVLPDDAGMVNPDTGRPFKFTRGRMLSIALNWGNEGNRAKLLNGYGWQERTVDAFLGRHMQKADWDFVQRVWTMFESHRDDVDALQRRVTGAGLDLVQALPFDTPHGRYAGGYYPIVYDAGRDFTAETHAEKSADAMFGQNYQRATTAQGHTISRVEGVKRPIQLSLDIVPWKIAQTIHDLAFRESVMDADRLLSSKEVKSAMDDVFGPEYRKSMRPWLKYVANVRNIDDAAIGWVDKALATARTNTVIVGIGFRLTTMFKHGMSALSNSFGELGAQWMLKGVREFYAPGKVSDNWKFITDKSPEMAYRLQHYDVDVSTAYDRLIKDSTYTWAQKQAQHFGHMGVSMLDLGSAAPTWLGAYRKALSEGLEDKDAVYYADKTVRNAHGAQGVTDLSPIQRAHGAVNLINMFYGFFNHIYNRQRNAVIQGSQGIANLRSGNYRQASRNFGQVLASSFYYVAIPAIVEALATKGLPNDNKDEGWGEWAAKAMLAEVPAGIPLLRDIAKAALEGRDYEISPVARAVDTAVKAGVDAYKIGTGEETPKGAAKHLVAGVGYVAGLPTEAPFTAGKFLWDINNGDADPQSIRDWYQGITSGKVTEK